MSKVTTEDKLRLIDWHIQKPRGLDDVPVLRAIKADVVKADTAGVSKVSEVDTGLYNQAMGYYRSFLRTRNSHLDMSGKKAVLYSRAMKGIIDFIRGFQKSNGKPSGDQDVLMGIQFIFANWDRLNQYHQNRIALPDIYDKIEEIIPLIKNGHDKRTTATSKIQQRKLELEKAEQARADDRGE